MRFVTIFPKLENVHLIKDVGMIPYILYKDFDFESILVSFNNNEYPYIETEVKGLRQQFLAGGLKYRKIWSNFFSMLYVLRNAKKIDVLNLYHFQFNNLVLMNVYKMINPNGIGFLKLDTQFRSNANDTKHANSLTGRKFGWIRGAVKRKLCICIDIMSAESHDTCWDIGNVLNREVIYIPNGYMDIDGGQDQHYDEKENIFLTVGRLGSFHKNTELLLDAFIKIYENCDWKLILIGSIEENIKTRLNLLYAGNIELKERIVYVGEISDRKLLFSYYNKAKVFLMPSRYENFSIATTEALSQGCYAILSDGVAPWKEFTDNGKFGTVFENGNLEQLSAIMLKVTGEVIHAEKIALYAKENFYWPLVCKKINEILSDKKRMHR